MSNCGLLSKSGTSSPAIVEGYWMPIHTKTAMLIAIRVNVTSVGWRALQ